MGITQNGALKKDDNDNPVMGGTSSSDNATIVNSAFDPVTRRLLTDNSGAGAGTVTSVSVVSANGLAGTVATATTTPAITLSTTITGVLKGDGTAISAASASTDYAALAFKTISVSGQSDVVADSPIDTLTLVGSGITITTDATTDTITFTGGASGLTVGTTAIASGTNTRILYDNSGVLGEYTITGTGTVVAMQTNPTLSGLTMTDATNMVFDTTTGTKIGTATTQKLAFYNSTPIVKPSGDVITALTNLGLVATPTIAATSIVVGTTTITSGTNTRILYDNSGTLGEYTLTGTGTVVVMATAPTFTTSITMSSANLITDTTTGTKIGTATNQKIGFFNATPIVQPTGDVITALQNLGLGATLTVAATTITSRTLWGQTYDGSGNVSGSLTAVGNITGGASSMTITAGTGNSRTLALQSTTSGGAATTFLTGDASQNTTLAGNLTLGASTSTITGAAGNMTIVAGTGNSRTLILQTTTSGGAATTALTLNADQTATFAAGATFGGTVAHGANSITMTGSLAATGARVTKGWFTDVESTNMPTVGGTAILTSLTAPQFTTIELGAASDTTLARVSAGVISVEGSTVGMLPTAQTWTAQNKFNNIIDVNNAVTVSSNAGTVPVTFRLNTFTNSSAATMAITMATASAVDGQMTIVRIYDSSAAAQTIGWTNTENSTVSVPTTSNGSTTLPLTVGFMFNSATTKWRCIASA